MNAICKESLMRPVAAVIVAIYTVLFKAAVVVAQETKDVKVDVDINNKGAGAAWYGNWWVWAIGVAVFLIVIVALTNRGGSKEAT